MTDVAIYLPSLRGGGAERVMVTLANGFAMRGLVVDLVLVSAEGPYLDEVAQGVRIVDLGAKRVLTSLWPLMRYLRETHPRAVLSAMSHANVVAILARALARVRIRLVVSERANVSQAQQTSNALRERAILPLMRCLYPRADGVVAVSSGVADDLTHATGLPRDSIRVLYNPVVTASLIEQAAAPPDHPWFASAQPPVVLGVGRLTYLKDFTALIRAFATVRAQRHCRLLILGEGELRTELEALVAGLGLTQDVDLPGFQSNPFVFMKHASIFVLSSRSEGLPSALIQAMACGTPVISTDCPSGPAEILEDGKWGRLVPVGDVDALSSAILTTLKESIRPDVTRRALDFGVEQSIDGYLDVLLRQ